MKSKLLRYLSVLIGVLMIAGLIFGALSFKANAASPVVPANVQENAANGLVSALDSGTWQPATRVWTQAEMAAAKPYPLPERSGERSLSIEPLQASGAPGLIPSGAPLGAKVETASEADLAVFDGASPLGYTYPAPFTRFKNFGNYNVFPYPTIGVLYFKQHGVSYRCSAEVIGTYWIWTAGHCVSPGDGTWSTDAVFYAQYRNGVAIKGIWTVKNLMTFSGWFNSADLRYDSGGAVLYKNASNKGIGEVTGWLGFAYNMATNQHWFAMGYPAASPFNGETQQICAASYAYSDTSMGSPYPRGIGCDQTGGTSGGPWIYKYSGATGATNYLNGNMSYRYNVNPLEIFSPYFNSDSKALYDYIKTFIP